MDIKEFLFKNNLQAKMITPLLPCTENGMSIWRRRQSSPKLLMSLKIMHLSGGQIKPEDLLSYEDAKEFKKWKDEIKKLK